eukprot:Nitzschia sp. Nitz4//scaffold10_size219509//99594//100670//NITZ4_001428-RA/size219509-processed-gene-0.76-mRNA-1//1//CDS//3329532920//4510//frame0
MSSVDSSPSSDSSEETPSLSPYITTFEQWWNPTGQQPQALVDVRPLSMQQKQSLSHSELVLVPFPADVLKERSFELPARHVPFALLVPTDDMPIAEHVLLGIKPHARKRPRKPWKVTHVLLDTPEFWEQAKEHSLVQSTLASPFPQTRLWQPDPMVQDVLMPLLRSNYQQPESLDTPFTSLPMVWDLASGAGRDVAFLAEELLAAKSPHYLVGMDHRYNEKESNITQGFWNRRGVGSYTQCQKVDLSDWRVVEQLAQENPELIISRLRALFAVRFWKPELVEAISKSDVLPSGVLFGLSHFCKPHDEAPWPFSHPSEKTVLERHQLSTLFSEWNILHDEIVLDSDHGRTMINFVAQKR